jgi:hypothetical protein
VRVTGEQLGDELPHGVAVIAGDDRPALAIAPPALPAGPAGRFLDVSVVGELS